MEIKLFGVRLTLFCVYWKKFNKKHFYQAYWTELKKNTFYLKTQQINVCISVKQIIINPPFQQNIFLILKSNLIPSSFKFNFSYLHLYLPRNLIIHSVWVAPFTNTPSLHFRLSTIPVPWPSKKLFLQPCASVL